MKKIDIARLFDVFEYDPSTGVVRNKVKRYKARAGDIVGTYRPDGYRQVCVDGTILLLHRVAFALAFGRWAEFEVDHANGDRSDNRAENLREATKSQNGANKRVCRDGLKGASFCERAGKWRASLRKDGKFHHIGLFDTAEAAHAAYVAAARQHHGEFARAA
jgi:hypothetical protein